MNQLEHEQNRGHSASYESDESALKSEAPAIKIYGAEKCSTPDDIADRYTFVRKLGQGTQAHVYEAIRKSDGQRVAIKQLRINSIQNWKEYELFAREAAVLKSLDIDGVAKVYETIENLDADNPHAYIVQQFLGGQNLAKMIASGYRFSLNRVFEIAVQLIDLLEKLHKHDPQVIHRDIKPSNIQLEPHGYSYKVYLMDFGAVANPVVQKGGSTVAGTFGYMPPEQQTGHPSPASDIYALAATIAFMLSGTDPADMPLVEYRLAIETPLQNVPHQIVACLRQMLMPRENERLCDYDTLRRMFSAFSYNRFDVYKASTATTRMTPKDFNTALKKVGFLCQRGNLDLWLNLPEQTPRKCPECYKDLRPAKLTSSRSLNASTNNIAIYSTIVIPIAIELLIGFLWGINSQDHFGHTIVYTLIIGLVLFIVLHAICIFCFKGFKSSDENVLSKRFPKRPPFGRIKGKNITSLVENGRKSMATVVDIQYLSVDREYAEQTVLYDPGAKEELVYTNRKLTPYRGGGYHGVPCFKVTYKFNPPDDASEDDLYHSCILHTNPAGTLAPGDMLPILYYIDPDDIRRVTSMPFPFPLTQFSQIDDMASAI